MVRLVDARAGQPRRGLLGEAHLEHGADREVGHDQPAHAAVATGLAQRADVGRRQAARADDRADAALGGDQPELAARLGDGEVDEHVGPAQLEDRHGVRAAHERAGQLEALRLRERGHDEVAHAPGRPRHDDADHDAPSTSTSTARSTSSPL
jgi:hypothetical protein